MILSYPSFEILKYSGLDLPERAGRLCYKSEPKQRDDEGEFIRKRIKAGHESIIEHSMMSVKFIVNRGVTHELVRHRLVSYSQESTRWCNYQGGVEFIIPPQLREHLSPGNYGRFYHFDEDVDPMAVKWFRNRLRNEDQYLWFLEKGWPPEEARGELPLCLKTEIIVTTNYREWRHILNLRALGKAGRPHPHMKEVMLPLLEKLKTGVLLPIFEDL